MSPRLIASYIHRRRRSGRINTIDQCRSALKKMGVEWLEGETDVGAVVKITPLYGPVLLYMRGNLIGYERAAINPRKKRR